MAVIIPGYKPSVPLGRLLPPIVDLVLVVNDASTDATLEVTRRHVAWVIDHSGRIRLGPAMRDALHLLRSEGSTLLP